MTIEEKEQLQPVYEKATAKELGENPFGMRMDVVFRAMQLYANQQSIAFAKWLEDTDKMKPFEYGSETAALVDNPEDLYSQFIETQLTTL